MKTIEQIQYEKVVQQNRDLQKELREAKAKLEHIKMVDYGNYTDFETNLKNLFGNKASLCGVEIKKIIRLFDDEVEKTGNLCLMCDGINKYIKYEEALKQALKLLPPECYFKRKNYSTKQETLRDLKDIITGALDVTTAKEAVEKANSEYDYVWGYDE